MTTNLVQPSLSGGELSPSLYGRVDLQRYQTSVALCRNWMVNLGGGLKNRPGTQFVSLALSNASRSRLVPFVFSASQAYVVEFGDRALRVVRNGSLLNTTVAVTAAAVGTGNGSQTQFQVTEPGPITATAVYRNDWQGNQQLYPTPRQNYTAYSESASNWGLYTGVTGSSGATAGPRPGSLADSLSYNGSGVAGAIRALVPIGTVGSSMGVGSVWLKASAPVTIILQDTNGVQVSCALTTSWQRFSVSGPTTRSAYQIAIYSNTGDNSAFTIYAFGAQIERGSTPSAYTPSIGATGPGPVITDYSYTSAGLFTFGEVPLTGAALTWTGTYNTTSGFTLTTPYAAADLALLSWTQSNDVLTLCHPNYPPQQLRRLSESNWQLVPQVFNTGPVQTINSDQTATVNFSGADGTVTITASKPIFTPDKVGGLFYVQQIQFSRPWSQGLTISAAGVIYRSDGKNYRAITTGTTGNSQPLQTQGTWNDGGVTWQFLDQGFGYCRITAVSADGLSATASTTTHIPDSCTQAATAVKNPSNIFGFPLLNKTQFTLTAHGYTVGEVVTWSVNYIDIHGVAQVSQGSAPIDSVVDVNNFTIANQFDQIFINGQFNSGGLVFTSATVSATSAALSYLWAFGAWNDTLGYPACVTYHQQRLTFAGSRSSPQTIWMSRTNSYGDFSQSNPLEDDDSLTFTFAASQENPIVAMLPLGQLIALTSTSAWVVGSYTQAPLSPSNLSARMQAYNGGQQGVPILGVDSAALFVQARGNVVRGFGYSYQYAYDNYSPANNLSIHADHLFTGHQIQEWAFQQVPAARSWAIREDGLMLGFTYNQEQQIVAWDRHDTLNGSFESVCCVPENNEDILYVAVRRVVNGATIRTLERMATRTVTDQRDGLFLDCAVGFDGRNKGTATVTLSGGVNWDETEHVTIAGSQQLFNGAYAQVGDQIGFQDPVLGLYYKLTIDAITSNTVATGIPNRKVPVAYQNVARMDWFWAAKSFTGLSYLANTQVSTLVDGTVGPTPTVDGTGKITLDIPGYRVWAGLPITADVQTVPVVFGPPDTGIERKKSIAAVRLQVNASTALFAGRDANNLFQYQTRMFENWDQSDLLTSGIEEVRIPTNWGLDGTVLIRNSNPLPAQLTAIIPEVALGGT